MSGILRAKHTVYNAYYNTDYSFHSNIELEYDAMIEKIKNTSNHDGRITINLDSSGELHSESEDIPAIKINDVGYVYHVHYDHGNILTGPYPYYICKYTAFVSAIYRFLMDDVEYKYFLGNSTFFSRWDCLSQFYITSYDRHLFVSDDNNIVAEFPQNDIWNCKFKFAD